MKILVFNCGSSSIKYQLFDMPDGKVQAKGILERIGGSQSELNHSLLNGSSKNIRIIESINNHDEAMKLIGRVLVEGEARAVESPDEIGAIGHRVVHGGEAFTGSVEINDRVIKSIEDFVPLAPLHNPPNLAGIKGAEESFKGIRQVAVFDTAFHQSLPSNAYLYALDYDLYKKQRIRKYGFHGTSHRYVSRRAAKLLGKPMEQVNFITCHLGNGCSMAAIKNGKSIDTTMGLTPLEGLVMGTRCGDIDPAVIFHLSQDMKVQQINDLLNKKSGLLGLSGISNDLRDIEAAIKTGNIRAQRALEVFCYRIKKYIGSYLAVLNSTDAIVFTGGIGENSTTVRCKSCGEMETLGVELDTNKNEADSHDERFINTENSTVKIAVIPTNEEKMIARETYEVIGKE